MTIHPALFEIFNNLPRQGPGSSESTQRAWSMLGTIPNEPRILDMGCGSGLQTLELARLAGESARITALDTNDDGLDILTSEAAQEGIGGRIETIAASMFEPPFDDASFDIIWSEGAIYIMGVPEALAAWKRLLAPDGRMVFSDAVWFKPGPPDEIREFWASEYPAIGTVDEKLAVIESAGYECIDHFSLPTEAWWDEYYGPMEPLVTDTLARYPGDQLALTQLNELMYEIDMYKRFNEWYGYEFFVTHVRS